MAEIACFAAKNDDLAENTRTPPFLFCEIRKLFSVSLGIIRLSTISWLRVLLSLMVVDAHYGFFKRFYDDIIVSNFNSILPNIQPCGPGNIAVGGFFIISGFLIAEILEKKYREKTLQGLIHFVLARSLRIYPLYLIVLTAFVIAHLLSSANHSHSPSIFLNYTLFYYGIADFFRTRPAWEPLFIFPAWTLAYDFIFYPIGAILYQSRKILFASSGLVLILYLYIAITKTQPATWIFFDYDNTWWNMNFYSTPIPNLLVFLLGMLTRLYAAKLDFPTGRYVILGSLGVVLYVAYLPYGLTCFSEQLLSIAAFLLLVNALAKNGYGKYDSFLSNWTFALYLIHALVFVFIDRQFVKHGFHHHVGITSLFVSIIIAALLAIFVEGNLIEKKRKAWLASWQPQNSTMVNYNILASLVFLLIASSVIFFFIKL